VNRTSDYNIMTLKYVTIETTTTCNQRCYFCPVSMAKRPKHHLSLTQLAKIIEELKPYPIEAIGLAGFYEPSCDKQLLEKIALIHEAGLAIMLFTNGSGLTPTLVDELLKSRLKSITINLSTVDKKRYQQTRKSHNLPQVISHLDYLLVRAEQLAAPTVLTIIMLGVLDKQHGLDIQHITERFNGFSSLQFYISPAGNIAGAPTPQGLNAPLYHKDLRGCARRYDTQTLYFSATGHALLCCHDYAGDYPLGQIDSATVTQLYQDKPIQQWRRWLSGAETAPEDFMCRRCVFGLSADKDYAQTLRELFCHTCELPDLLGTANSCHRCEVATTLKHFSVASN